jgi:hypothetical protein
LQQSPSSSRARFDKGRIKLKGSGNLSGSAKKWKIEKGSPTKGKKRSEGSRWK